MRNAYQEQMRELHEAVVRMGCLCTQAVTMAVQAVTEGDQSLAAKAVELDKEIDKLEREIESQCLKLLLQQQPVASDLRKISATLKMISDLERIGDQASDIAELSRHITGTGDWGMAHLHEMAGAAIKMVSDGVKAFLCGDLLLAKKVIQADQVVDDWFLRIKSDLIVAIRGDNTLGEQYLDVLMVAKYLERIGDHATNVAEWVEHSILGKRSKNGILPD